MKNIKLKLLIASMLLFVLIVLLQVSSNAAITATSKTINSGEDVTISVDSTVGVLSYKVTVTSEGGLIFKNSSGGTGAGSKTITNGLANTVTSLAKFTFTAPSVTQDTTYNVSFAGTIMEDENFNPVADSNATATITVKAPVVETPKEPVVETPKPEELPTGSDNSKGPTVTKSTNNYLKSLTISESGLTPKFTKKTTKYTVDIAKEVEKIEVIAVAEDSKAKVKISGNKNLKEGNNNIKVTVTAENGKTRTYTVTAVKPITPKITEDDIVLSTLTLKGITIDREYIDIVLDKEFSKEILEYSVTVPDNMDSLQIDTTSDIETNIIVIDGNTSLQEGLNTITIKVTSEDGSLTKTYTLLVTKEPKKIEDIKEVVANTSIIENDTQIDNTHIIIKIIVITTILGVFFSILYYFLDLYQKSNKEEISEELEEMEQENTETDINTSEEDKSTEEKEKSTETKEENVEEKKEVYIGTDRRERDRNMENFERRKRSRDDKGKHF